MELLSQNPLIFLLVTLNYLLVAVTLVHLIFKTDYTLTGRLVWMVVLWVIPVVGLVAYWVTWNRRDG
ncbi:MAG: PLDc N-terminal domain-containing protein [Hymenobacteraceae bacterium]|nr:PLDc N-terminal domain-containing protein [Hymenobacteraceae bacterium]MDX5480257.1 PLDc N-terminal domain-containing protein [Hymenobacteraceae bacterium]